MLLCTKPLQNLDFFEASRKGLSNKIQAYKKNNWIVKETTSALTTTPSGLKYKTIREGTGRSPKVSNRVNAHYAGWLTDGTGFDNSYDRGAPSEFPLAQVIPGWTEGLQLMKEGDKWLLTIPPKLAYGARGAGYRGCQSVTRSGLTCQSWAAQTPHQHSLADESAGESAEAAKNRCRNPDGGDSIWCYTTDSRKRWEYCNPIVNCAGYWSGWSGCCVR